MRRFLLLFVIFVLSGCSQGGGTKQLSVNIAPSGPQAIDVAQSVTLTANVVNDKTAAGVTWSVSGPGSITSSTASSTSYVAPASGSGGQAIVTATSVTDPAATKSVTVSVTAAPKISTTALPGGMEGAVYSQSVQVSGGAGALNYSVSAGALPVGLSLNSGTGMITGTPMGPNTTSNFTVKVSDSSAAGSQNSTQALSIAVNLPAAPAITTASLPAGVEGTPYNQAIQATGNGPMTYSVSAGSLPAGLTMGTGGTISGSPVGTNGVSNFTVKVTDGSNPPQTGTQPLSITINLPPAPVITTTTLQNGSIGSAYSQQIGVTGGLAPFTWSVTSGTLPAGITLNAASGSLSGAPTGPNGTSNFTVSVADSSKPQQSAIQPLKLIVAAQPLSVATNSLPNATVGVAYTAGTLQATGGTVPITWSVTAGTLPAGLTLNAATGAITGTPTTQGMSTFTVEATDSGTPTAQNAQQQLSITVAAASACGTGAEGLLNGDYSVSMIGFQGSSPAGVIASFTADGAGHVTAGVEDINSSGSAGVQKNVSVTTAGSSYSVGTDHRGCLTLVAGGATRTFRFALGGINSGVSTTGHIIEFDATGMNVGGTIRKQNPTAFSNAQVSGNYAFGVAGVKSSFGNGTGKFGAVGQLTFSGSSVSGIADSNDGALINGNGSSYPTAGLSLASGSYSIGSNGRGTMSFTPNGGTKINTVVYVVSAQELMVMSIDAQTTNSLFTGEILQQTGTPYTNASLNATGVLYTSGLSSDLTSNKVDFGFFTPNSTNATFSYSGDENDGGMLFTGVNQSGSYSVGSNGRTTFSTGQNEEPVLYLVAPNKGFVLFTGGDVMTGFLEQQIGAPYTNASLQGTYSYGIIDPGVASSLAESGTASFDAVSNVAGAQDDNLQGTLTPGQSFSTSYSVTANGKVSIPAGASSVNLAYVVSPTRFVLYPLVGPPPAYLEIYDK